MRRLLALILLLAAVPAVSQERVPEQAAIPDTPAGRIFTVWLNVYNSADPDEIERYNAFYDRKSPPESWIDTHDMTGRIAPVRVETDGPNTITVLLSAEKGDGFWRQRMTTDPADPMKLLDAGFGQALRPAEFAIPRLPKAELDRGMADKLAEDVAADRFAGTVMVQRHGKIIYKTAVGLADREGRVPVTMDTKFRIGSANKMFTAIGMLQLVDRGQVSLDAPIGTYLKDYPNEDFARTITVRQLLSHTGGAGDIFTPEYEARRLQTRTLADYVELFGSQPPDRSEDGKGAYANYGFVLLGRLIEVVSGENYYDYVREHISAPAGMTDTGSLPEEVDVPNRSNGYMKGEKGELVDNAETLPWRGSAAGGGYTTASDLIRFADALLAGTLLSKELLAQATSPQRPDGWYGFGFFTAGEGPTRN